MYRELDSADYEILGRDKQVGAEMRDGVIVSNSFEERFSKISPEKTTGDIRKISRRRFQCSTSRRDERLQTGSYYSCEV